MKRTLFQFKNNGIEIEINAAFEGGELVVEAFEKGEVVQAYYGDTQCEYAVILPEQEVAELRHVLNLNPFARKDLLETLATRFNDSDCVLELKNYLEKQGIGYRLYSWAA
jgi:hypothetical protein